MLLRRAVVFALLACACGRTDTDVIRHVRSDDVVVPEGDVTPPVIVFLGPDAGSTGPLRLTLHVHDGEASMPRDGVDLAYSTDNRRSWNVIAAGLALDRESADAAVATLTYDWTPPTSEPLIVRITARDRAGNAVKQTTPLFNTRLRILAGGVFDDDDVSARYTTINAHEYYDEPQLAMLVREPTTGTLFVGDLLKGLRVVDGATGIISAAPLAGNAAIVDIARDDFGAVYGCNGTGIYRWSAGWLLYLDEPCDRIGASKTRPGHIYWLRSGRLYRHDGVTSAWVAFNGGAATGSGCYALAPADATTSCSPTRAESIAVDADDNAYIPDDCGETCSARLLRFTPGSGITIDPAPYGLNVTYVSRGARLIAADAAVHEEDPVTGELYIASRSVVARYPADVRLDSNTYYQHHNLPDVSQRLAIVAGIPPNSGNGGPATRAHLLAPKWLAVGNVDGVSAQSVFVQSDEVCCLGWSNMVRAIGTAMDAIADYSSGTVYTNRDTESAIIPVPGGGFLSTLVESRPFVRQNGVVAATHTGPRSCTVSPADGASAASTNWPWETAYFSNYDRGLVHGDGHVYLAGYRNTGAGTICNGVADVAIKRFSLDRATGAVGNVEPVLGVVGPRPAADTPAAGESATSFALRGVVRRIRERADGALVVLQGGRLRVITRVDPNDTGSWTVDDLTAPISVDAVDFVLTGDTAIFTDGSSTLTRYSVTTGEALPPLVFPGMDDMEIHGIGVLDGGDIVFSDGRRNGVVYRLTP